MAADHKEKVMDMQNLVGAVDQEGTELCLSCTEEQKRDSSALTIVDDITETDAIKDKIGCDRCGRSLLDVAEEVNDPRKDMSYAERADDEFGELYT